MSIIGQVESVWRYPVKSMRGEELPAIFAGYSGVYGDRLYAFKSSAAPAGFPFFTGRERHEMLLYRPRFRHPDRAAVPPNLEEALRTLEHAEKSGNRTRNEASTDLRFVISEAKHIIRSINATHQLLSTKLPNYEPYQRAKK